MERLRRWGRLGLVRWLRAIGGWRCEAFSRLLSGAAVAQWVEPPAALVRQQTAKELPREQRRVLLPRQVDVKGGAPHLHMLVHMLMLMHMNMNMLMHMLMLMLMPCLAAAWSE